LKGRPIAHGGALLLRLEMQSQGHSAQQVLGHQSLAKNAGEILKAADWGFHAPRRSSLLRAMDGNDL
jgi:hypothetical protein